MRWSITLVGLVVASALPLVARAQAPAKWATYRYPDLGFSFEAPQAPERKDSSKQTPNGTAYESDFTADLGDRDLMVIVLDFRRLTDGDMDVDTLVARATKGQGPISADKPVSEGGLVGRDVVYGSPSGGDAVTWTARFFYSGHVAYQFLAFAVGATPPAEAERFKASFALLRSDWRLYTMPEVQPAGDLAEIPFSRWVRASPKDFTSMAACRAEADNHPRDFGQRAYESLRFMDAVCFDPGTRHVRSIKEIPELWNIPPIDVPGVVADPFMR